MKSKFWLMAAFFAFLFLPGGATCAGGLVRMEFNNVNSPTGMVYDKNGSLYVSEWGAGRIIRIKDGKTSMVLDELESPAGLAFDSAGNLYFAGYGDGNIWIWKGNGKPRVLASGFSAPTGILWNEDKKVLLVANRNAGEVVEVNASGNKKVISRGHKTPVGVAQTDDGQLFVSCYGGSVDVIAPNGAMSSVSTGFGTPGVGIVPAGSNSVYVVDYARGNIAHVNSSGLLDIMAKGLTSPVGLVTMPDENLLVGCWGDNSLKVITIKE